MAIEFRASEIVSTLTKEIQLVREQIGVAFMQDIVTRTPVDTGHARRNWQANYGAPNGNELPGVDRAGSNTVTNGVTKIKVGRTKNAFIPLVIENNVPYIGRLNDGWSRQAPAQFVELAIRRALNAVPERKNI
jgi:hypothetical protein